MVFKVSVIVPVYNVADYVEACLESLKRQSFSNFEVLIIDDGATDDSIEIAVQTIGDDPRFRIISRENGGLSAARNTGLSEAQADVIGFVDSDDRLHPDYLMTMYTALQTHGADWVACGIQFTHDGGDGGTHSAIHGAPQLQNHLGAACFPFKSWPDIIRHFPSAWNKLYRRSFIGETRFDEGTYYEDHAFFQRLASRSDYLLHIPEPLYLHLQGREGQITREETDRIFEQISVLETLQQVMKASGKPGGFAGLAQLATRLVYERSLTIRDPARRARFAAAAQAFFGGNHLPYYPQWDPAISLSWGRVMQGQTPLTVVIPTDGDLTALQGSLESLREQSFRDVELLIIMDSGLPVDEVAVAALAADVPHAQTLPSVGAGVAATRNTGLDVACGDLIVFLDAGDRLKPGALTWRVENMLRTGADFGFSPFHIGTEETPPHSGFHDPDLPAAQVPEGPVQLRSEDQLGLHAHPSAKIFRRAFLLEQDIRFPEGAFSSWLVTLQAAARARISFGFISPGIIISNAPECRKLWRHPLRFQELYHCLNTHLTDLSGDGLGAGAGTQLLVRGVWEKLNFSDFPSEEDRAAFQSDITVHFAQQSVDWAHQRLDPYVGPYLRSFLGAPID
ncbi:MAG: glycosyltransferase [Pseudoruegeria sp.]